MGQTRALKTARASRLLVSLSVLALMSSAEASSTQRKDASKILATKNRAGICQKKWIFDKTAKKLFVPSSMPLQFLLTAPSGGEGPFPLAQTSHGSNEAWLQFPEGEHHMSVSASHAQEYHIVSDGTAPKTLFTFSDAPTFQKSNNLYYGKGLTLTLTPEDNIAGIAATYFSLNGAPIKATEQKLFKFEHDGSQSLTFLSCDRVGNEEPAQHFQFVIDQTAPVSAITIKGVQHLEVLGKDAQIAMTATDALAGVGEIHYKFDDQAEQHYELPLQLEALKPGTHRLTYYAVDNVGNKESAKVFQFIFDPLSPQVRVSFQGKTFKDNGITYLTKAAVAVLTVEDKNSKIAELTCQWGKAKASPCKDRLAAPTEDGESKLTVSARDVVGNTMQIEEAVHVDSTAPKVTWEIMSPHLWEKDVALLTVGARVNLEASDQGAGIADLRYCINNTCKPWKEALTFDKVGEWDLTAIAKDHVGNESMPTHLHLRVRESRETEQDQSVDVKKAWVADPDAGTIGPAKKAFRMQITDGRSESARRYTLDVPKEFMDELLKNREQHSLKIQVGGYAGKIALPIDALAPVTSISFHGAKRFDDDKHIYFSSGLQVDLQAAEPHAGHSSGVQDIYFNLNGRGMQVYKTTLKDFTAEQEYRLNYRSIGRVGNQEESQSLTFIVDTTPPTTEVVPGRPFYHDALSLEGGITLKAKDNLSGVQDILFGWDQGSMHKYSDAAIRTSLAALSEGTHTLRYSAVDHVGNREPEKVFHFRFDKSAPQLAYEMAGTAASKDKTIFVKAGTHVVLKASDSIAGIENIEYAWDAGKTAKFSTYQSPLTVAEDGGPHILTFVATDHVGHRSAVKELKFQTEKSLPLTNLSFHGYHSVFGKRIYLQPTTTLELTAQDEGAGVQAILYRIGSGSFQTYTSPLKFPNGEETELTFLAVNRVGIREAPHQYRLIFDRDRPHLELEASIVKSHGKVDTLPAGALMRVTALDSQSGIKEISYRINNSPKRLYRGPFPMKKAGTYKVEVIATDWVSHEEKTSYDFVVE